MNYWLVKQEPDAYALAVGTACGLSLHATNCRLAA